MKICGGLYQTDLNQKSSESKFLQSLKRVGDCYGGIPIIMTAPHFWNADKDLVTQMNGVKPDRELHDTFLDIEPITGVALSAHKRIQVFLKIFSHCGYK